MAKRFTPPGCFLERIEPRVTWLTESYIIESRAVQRSAGRHDIAEDLERCIHLLIRAQMVADELYNRGA